MARLNDTEAIRQKMPGGAPRSGAVGDSVSFESLSGQLASANYRPATFASRGGYLTGRKLSAKTDAGPEGQSGAHDELCKSPTPTGC